MKPTQFITNLTSTFKDVDIVEAVQRRFTDLHQECVRLSYEARADYASIHWSLGK